MGTTFAPLFGGWLILSRSTGGTSNPGHVLTEAERLADARSVELPYLIVAAVLVVLAFVIHRSRLPDLSRSDLALEAGDQEPTHRVVEAALEELAVGVLLQVRKPADERRRFPQN